MPEDFEHFEEQSSLDEDFTEQLGIGKDEKVKQFGEKPGEVFQQSIEMDWIIHYGNLMTILMFFFMILYAFSNLKTSSSYEKTMAGLQRTMGGDAAQLKKLAKQENETNAAAKMEGFIKDKNLAQFAKVETNAQRVKISLSNPILFESGSADLKPEAVPALREIAALINSLPNSVVVEGHTDNLPFVGKTYRSNFELSAARAFSVIKYFIDNEKTDPARFTAFGYGEYSPLFPNDSDQHRAMNRRIEINIIR